MKKPKLTLLRRKWLKAYLNGADQTEAARLAGYKAKTADSFTSIGYQNFVLLHDEIVKWLDENDLSEAALKQRLVDGFSVKETKFFADKGMVVTEIEVDALSEQRRYVEMAIKVRGLNAPERRELTGKDGEPISVSTKMDPKGLKEAMDD